MEVEITVIEENFETIDSLEKILNLIKRRGIQIKKIEYLYYPYWIISLTVIVKQLFGVREFKKVHLMIEGLTGIIGYCEEPRLKGRYAEKEKLLEPKVKKPRIEEKIKKFILETFPREYKISMIKEITINNMNITLAYKKFWILDLFNPGNGKRTKLLIDSVSGATEYVLSYDSS
ncbi:hypothetical protein DRN51_00815 [Thermococci archaeon]|nr:MAG: hypothetical protein DRN51_00815 [Thermococci archaeon]